jgi:hypothetical protein
MTSLPTVQEYRWPAPTGTITCSDDLVLDDIGMWVAELLKEMRLIKRFYDLDQRGFWVGSKFVTVGEGA